MTIKLGVALRKFEKVTLHNSTDISKIYIIAFKNINILKFYDWLLFSCILMFLVCPMVVVFLGV